MPSKLKITLIFRWNMMKRAIVEKKFGKISSDSKQMERTRAMATFNGYGARP